MTESWSLELTGAYNQLDDAPVVASDNTSTEHPEGFTPIGAIDYTTRADPKEEKPALDDDTLEGFVFAADPAPVHALMDDYPEIARPLYKAINCAFDRLNAKASLPGLLEGEAPAQAQDTGADALSDLHSDVVARAFDAQYDSSHADIPPALKREDEKR